VKQFALKFPPLALIRERENVFKLLSASTNDSLQKNYAAYTIDPKTRYSALDTKKVINLDSLKCLYDTDDVESADLTINSPSLKPRLAAAAKKRTVVERRKSSSSSGGASRPSGRSVSGKTKRKLERECSKHAKTEEQQLSIGDKTKFFEEHNKKVDMDNQASKVKVGRVSTLSSSDFSGLEEIDEDLDEGDDDVMVEEEPVTKKKSVSGKQSTTKEQEETTTTTTTTTTTLRGKPVKRQASKESIKRQSSKELPKVTKQGKLLKRQASKDDCESANTTEDLPVVSASKKKVFTAKGGGLKNKTTKQQDKTTKSETKLSEKSTSSAKHRASSSGDKKSGKKKSKKQVKQREEDDDVFFTGEERSRKQSDPVDPRSFFSKWMGSLLPKLALGSSIESPLETCAQASVVSVMAVTLLLDCPKLPTRPEKTESKLQELLANYNKKETTGGKLQRRDGTEELLSIRAGCVKASMAKWQMMAEKEEKKGGGGYYEFLKKTSSETATESDTTTDGNFMKHSSSDFSPKDVIDVEEQLLAEEEEEKRRSSLAKMLISKYGKRVNRSVIGKRSRMLLTVCSNIC